jgi:ankyrin repeat protein
MEELNVPIRANNFERIHELLGTLHLSPENLYRVLRSCIDNIRTNDLILSTNDMKHFELILQHIDVNFIPNGGLSHLLRVVVFNNIQLTRLLLEHGADPVLSESNRTTLKNMGYLEMLDLIDTYNIDDIKEPEV